MRDKQKDCTADDPLSFGVGKPSRVNEAFVRYRAVEDVGSLREVDHWTHAFVVRYFAIRCARNRQLGEVACDELVGLALERIVRRRNTVDRPERYVGWVRTLCRNLLIDATRRPRMRSEMLCADGGAEPFTEPRWSDSSTGQENLAAVHSAIGRLPSYLRTPAQLRLVEGLPYTEVAGATGKSVATLRAYIQRAVMLLRKEVMRRSRA